MRERRVASPERRRGVSSGRAVAIVVALSCARCGGSDGVHDGPFVPDASAKGGREGGAPIEGGRDGGRPERRDGGHDAGHPVTDAAPDAMGLVNTDVCGVGSAAVAWSASIPATASTLVLSDIAAGPSDDVVVADQAGATYEQHRWNDAGAFVSVHQDPIGSYAGRLWASSIIVDTKNNLFYGMLKTGLVEGKDVGAELSFTILPPTGAPVVSPPITSSMPTSVGAPQVLLFSTGFDSGGGYHGPLSMAAPQYYPAGVYCYGSTLASEATSAQSVTATLTTGDFEWPSQSSSLYVLKAVNASVDLGCGKVSVPASGGLILASLDSGGSCQWNKFLALPTSSVKTKNFRVGADGTLALAVAYTGSIDFGHGPLVAAGPTSLAVARFDGSGNLLFAKSFGGATSSFTIGSLGVNGSGVMILTSGYAGSVDLGGGALPASDDTLLAVFDATGAFKWSRTVVVGGSGELIAAAGTCGMAVATNSPSVDLGTGPLSTVKAGQPSSIGVAALGL